MPTYATPILLRQLQQKTESLLDTAVSEWQMIPHTRFARKPSAESWSANECLQHLNSYGRYYLPAIEKAIENSLPPASPLFHSGFLGHYFTTLMMPADNRKSRKMKSPKEHAPTTIPESHMVISEFIDQQEKLLQLLKAAATVDINRAKVPVSISKWIRLKLGDTFNFFVAHEHRHFLQAQKALGIDISSLQDNFSLKTISR